MARFTIRKKILVGFIIGAVVPIFSLEVLDIQTARTELRMQQIEALDAIADLKQQRIESFFQHIAEDVELLSHLDFITDNLPVVNEHFADRENEDYQAARAALDIHLIPTREGKNFLEIILADGQGRMVYNTGAVHNDEELGMSVEALVKRDVFQGGRTVYVSDVFQSPFSPSGFEIVSAAPVYEHFGSGHHEGHHGDQIGMVILAIDMGPVYKLILDTKGLGTTGETLLGRNEGDHALFINPLRHDQDAALKHKIPYTSQVALPIRQATQGIAGSGVTTDYRSEPIIASWRPLRLPSDNLSWGMVAKIDTSEAFAASSKLLRQALYIGLGAIVLLIIANMYLGHAIVRPLNLIRRAAGKIASGSLDVTVPYKGKNEIGDVAASFNHMTQELADTRARLAKQNAMLEGSVSELEKKNKQIERSKKATLNILEDVQEEKENTAREKERIAAILQSIGDGVFVVDKEQKIQIMNPVAATLAGCDPVTAVGKPYKDVLNFVFEKNGKVNDAFIVDAFRTGEVQEMSNHTLLVKPDGTKTPVADSAAPLKNAEGDIYGCVVVFRDVTKEYAIDKAKTEFVSLASHQLRTPLAAINWNLEILLEDKEHELDEDQQQALKDVYGSSRRLSDLVTALLNVSRIELGTFIVEPKPTDVVAMAKDVVKDLAPRITEKKLKVTESYTPKKLVVPVDPKLMRIVLENLVSNAVKYTPEKKKIDIRLQKKGKNLHLEVQDYGYGIPRDQQDKIFTRLFRADNVRSKDVEGTGLGLYIVKSIIEHSHGQVWFESKEKKGTTFFVTLPLTGMRKKTGSKSLS